MGTQEDTMLRTIVTVAARGLWTRLALACGHATMRPSTFPHRVGAQTRCYTCEANEAEA